MSQETYATRIAQLQAEHGSIAHVVIDGKLLAFRKPNQDEWEDFQENVGTGKKRRGTAYRELSLRCLLEPSDPEVMASIFERLPALNSQIGNALASLAGNEIELTVKKG